MPYGRRPRKRPGSRKRKYTRKRSTTRRRAAPKRRRKAPASTSYGRNLARIPISIPDRTRMRVVKTINFTDTITIHPNANAQTTNGMGILCFRASSPNFIYPTSNQLGLWVGINSANTLGTNQQMKAMVEKFTHNYVIQSKITIVATPISTVQNETTLWSEAATLYLTLSKSSQPWNTTVPPLLANASKQDMVRAGRLVKAGRTISVAGSQPKSTMLTGVYTPRKTHELRDLADRTSGFANLHGTDWQTAGTQALHPSYWNLQLMPGCPVYDSVTTTLVNGTPRPHRIDVKVSYKCLFYNPRHTVGGAYGENAPPP